MLFSDTDNENRTERSTIEGTTALKDIVFNENNNIVCNKYKGTSV